MGIAGNRHPIIAAATAGLRKGLLAGLGVLVAGCSSVPSSGGGSVGAPALARPAASTITASRVVPANAPSSSASHAASLGQPIRVPQIPVSAAALPAVTPGLTSLDFTNSNDGWIAVGGRILGTTDGGESWKTAYAGPAPAKKLDFLNAADGWATDGDGVLRTTDGGVSWQPLPGPNLSSVDFVSASAGFGLGGGVLEKTVDGGRTWHAVSTAERLQQFCFSNGENGWGLTAPPKSGSSPTPAGVERTSDGGKTWTTVPATSAPVIDLSCAGGAAFVLTAPASSGSPPPKVLQLNLYRSGHGGEWTQVAEMRSPNTENGPPWRGLVRIATGGVDIVTVGSHSAGPSTVIVAHGAETSSGALPVPLGAHWILATAFTAPDTGWIATASSFGWTLSSNASGAWKEVYSTAPVAPAYAISFVSPTVGYGLGSVVTSTETVVLRTTDAGKAWTAIGDIPAAPLAPDGAPHLSFLDAMKGWATIGGGLWATTDGGRTWSLVQAKVTAGQFGGNPNVDFVNSQDGCLSTGAPDMGRVTYLQTLDGGRLWSTLRSPSLSLWACAASAAGITGATSPYCMQEHTAFDTYLVPLGYGSAYYGSTGFWSSGGNLSLAWNLCNDGDGMALFMSSNGGRTWSALRVSGTLVGRFSFASPKDGWALSSGHLYRTTDGGRSWTPLPPVGVMAGR